ncbi:MAG TPA: hypothetical protein VF188_06465 [Longimicrobiales bacterium]
MNTATTISSMLARLAGLTAVILGVVFWTGHGITLLPVHMVAGAVLVLALWTLAILGAVAGLPAGRVALAVVWGLVVPILGMTQTRLLPGSLHWLIQIVHLAIGMGAVGIADGLAKRIRARGTVAAEVVGG